MKTKACIICGKHFLAKYDTERFCSNECVKKHIKNKKEKEE